jgi:hypothetical protein
MRGKIKQPHGFTAVISGNAGRFRHFETNVGITRRKRTPPTTPSAVRKGSHVSRETSEADGEDVNWSSTPRADFRMYEGTWPPTGFASFFTSLHMALECRVRLGILRLADSINST